MNGFREFLLKLNEKQDDELGKRATVAILKFLQDNDRNLGSMMHAADSSDDPQLSKLLTKFRNAWAELHDYVEYGK